MPESNVPESGVYWDLARPPLPRNPIEQGVSAFAVVMGLMEMDDCLQGHVDAALDGLVCDLTDEHADTWRQTHYAVARENPIFWYQQLPQPARELFVLHCLHEAELFEQEVVR